KAAEALHAAGRAVPGTTALIALGAVTSQRAAGLFGRCVARATSTDAAGLAAAVAAALARNQGPRTDA
ncbi:MAG TPA: hypothetical protein VIY27_12265, partial [Myxococcota bacterium]